MILRFCRYSLPVLAALAIAPSAWADAVDITLHANSNGQLEVKLRPTANFDGVVSSLVFTVKWDAASDARLGDPVQTDPASTFLPISRSSSEQVHGGSRYQTFTGFGITPMRALPASWVAGQEYTVLTIPVRGTAVFSLANDSWTAANNADYYLALAGTDETGAIYGDLSTGLVPGETVNSGLRVMPNPAEKATMITMDMNQARDLRFELLNAASQVVWSETRPGAVGQVKVPLDLSRFDKGVYLLRVHGLDEVLTERVVSR